MDRDGTDGVDREINVKWTDGTDGVDSEINVKWTEMVRTVWTVRLIKRRQRLYGWCGQ